MEFRNDIQGLRAVAVLMVWVFHINSNLLPGGFIGVDVFFVLSGFLISSIILHQKEKNKFTFKDFYISRIKRIIPAYYVFLIIISIATILIYLPSDLLRYKMKLFHSFIFNSNNFFATLDNYFDTSSAENPLLHTWTLAVEMQFYLFLPFLLCFFNRAKSLALSVAFFFALLIYGQYNIYVGNQNLMYFSLLARAPEFLLGVILSLTTRKNTASYVAQSIMSSLGLVIILLSAFIIDSDSTFPGLLALIPGLGVAIILYNKDSLINKALAHKSLVFIGGLSYSIYLWHWGILALIRYYYVEYFLSVPLLIFAILGTLIFSYLSFRFVENTLRKVNLKTFIYSFSLLPILIVAIIGGIKTFSLFSEKKNYPIELTSAKAMGLENHSQYLADIIQGDLSSKDTLLLLGHSHALVYKPFIDVVGKESKFAFRSVTNGNYATLPGYPLSYFPNKSEYEKYLTLIDIVKSKINSSPIIIVATTFTQGTSLDHLNAFKSLDSLVTDKQQVILLSDFPTLDKNPIRINRGIIKPKTDAVEFKLRYDRPPSEVMEFINSHPNFHFLDMSNSEAFNDVPYFKDTIMYFDAAHLNVYGSKVYAKFSGGRLSDLLQNIRGLSSSITPGEKK